MGQKVLGSEGPSKCATSSDGKTVVIGTAGYTDVNGLLSGRVQVYAYDGTQWNQLGGDICGESSGAHRSGDAVSISSNETIVAIGARNNDGNGSDSGHVRVYSYNGTQWLLMGMDIDGENAGDNAGTSVTISSRDSSTTVAIAKGDGTVRIFTTVCSTDGTACTASCGVNELITSDGTFFIASCGVNELITSDGTFCIASCPTWRIYNYFRR